MRRLYLFLAIAVAAAAAAAPASAASPALTITSIECGLPPDFGTGVELAGTGFTPGGTISITYSNAAVTLGRTETADAAGDVSFSYTLTGSLIPPGTVTAVDVATGLSASIAIPQLGGNCGTGLPTTKAQCKDGGWRTFEVFKNEGDCVSFVATGGRNAAG